MFTLSGDLPTSTNTSGIVVFCGQIQTHAADYYKSSPGLDANCIRKRLNPTQANDDPLLEALTDLLQTIRKSAVLQVYTANSGETNATWHIIKQAPHKKHPLSAFLGSWKGKDLKEMLKMAIKTRSQL